MVQVESQAEGFPEAMGESHIDGCHLFFLQRFMGWLLMWLIRSNVFYPETFGMAAADRFFFCP
jgi:hypothetical protein